MDFLDYTKDYYFKNKIDYYIINGDIFHKSSNIKNESFIPLFLKMHKMKEEGIKFIILFGNHDIINVDNDSILETFLSLGKIVKNNLSMTIEDKNFYFLSYTKNEEDLPDNSDGKYDYLITHLSIADFSFDNAFSATEKHAFKRNLFENFTYVFTGHFHRHQGLGNIIYVGSPNQMERSEAGQKKGFVVLDTQIENWEFIEYNNAPKFLNISIEEIMHLNEIDFTNSRVSVIVDKKIKDFAKLRYILCNKGAIEVNPVFETEDVLDEEDKINDIELNGDYSQITKDFIDETFNDNEITKKELIKLFDKISTSI